MWRASSATWICMIRRISGCCGDEPRSTAFCMWSIGSSPASTPAKKAALKGIAARGSTGASSRNIRGPPGTSMPERFTNSWNIWVWWHSSVASWVL